ncbi:MAG: zinc-dependent peptidase [Flavobacteriaceae bacterium]|nr:zinc-dependent peptidase [Flavobacteriaceae bacterium]
MVGEEVGFGIVFVGSITVALSLLIAFLFFKMLDTVYLSWFKRPAWVHFYVYKKKLSEPHKSILRKRLSFYNRLSSVDKRRFEHRLQCFLNDKEFIPRQGFVLKDEHRLSIAATAIMLTFGMRKYMLPILERIIVYPEAFYSTIDERYHKGEFNPSLKALVLSWEDFEEGFRIEDDNLNLGIHEFTHAIHLNSIKRTDTASVVFSDGFSELLGLLRNEDFVTDIKNSGFIRDYAFTNEFEFLAVVVENFIESPVEFRNQFPSLYKKIQQMFNFRFAGY